MFFAGIHFAYAGQLIKAAEAMAPAASFIQYTGLFLSLPCLPTTTRLAGTALLFTLALLAFTFLSLAFLSFAVFLLALLSRGARFARFVRILLCVHITFRSY